MIRREGVFETGVEGVGEEGVWCGEAGGEVREPVGSASIFRLFKPWIYTNAGVRAERRRRAGLWEVKSFHSHAERQRAGVPLCSRSQHGTRP